MSQMFALAFAMDSCLYWSYRKRPEAQLHRKENVIRKKKILNKTKLY